MSSAKRVVWRFLSISNDGRIRDIAPYLVLAELWDGAVPVFVGGKISRAVATVIEAVKLRKPMRMAPFKFEGSTDVWALPVQRRASFDQEGSADRVLGPQKREKVTDDFCDWIDECLGVPEINQQLTMDGKQWLAGIVSELLDNAERHSGPTLGAGTWSTTGFMSRYRPNDGEPEFVLCMAFMSLGRTISSSLNECSELIRQRLDEYCQRHRACGLSRDALRTIVALQDYVTRLKDAADENRGGIGFQEVIDQSERTDRQKRGPD